MTETKAEKPKRHSITGKDARDFRALFGWTLKEMAVALDVHWTTLFRLEHHDGVIGKRCRSLSWLHPLIAWAGPRLCEYDGRLIRAACEQMVASPTPVPTRPYFVHKVVEFAME